MRAGGEAAVEERYLEMQHVGMGKKRENVGTSSAATLVTGDKTGATIDETLR